jgi:Uma2 family endonuclease
MTTVKPQEWTYEDYLAFPEEGPLRYEVIDGELYTTPAPTPRHQRIIGKLFRITDVFLMQNPLGEMFLAPIDVIFAHSPLQYMEPDLVYVSNERSAIVTEQNIQGAPDLVVEVLSRTTSLRDRREKRSLYERFGVPEYWIVDPETKTVQIFRLVEGHFMAPLDLCKTDILESPLLPGLSVSFSVVFSS